ncbi:MAG: circularly permuted type 2 ATP-grasp protein [Gemmataceae bacterium]
MPDRLTTTENHANVGSDIHFEFNSHSGSGYDESTDSSGVNRPHWNPFFESLRELGPEEMSRRWREAREIIRENGVTYNVYGDPHGIARPWQLDPIPLLLTSADSRLLESSLRQRAKLLELILSDLYGPQRILKSGLIPAEVIFQNSSFLRSVHGIQVPGDRYLHLYAANLGRGHDGRWYVIGDRTQAPSGAGYALENRIVMTRTLTETFRDCRVHRLAQFFQTFRETLRSLAPRNRENPRVVLLTPGPYNETYFEHAYLARYLGYTLVEGGDLTVRDNRVYLKMLGGLQPVEVIFRRLDDDYCDPLELRPDSFLGVPGLVHAVRSGNVAVANALGTGLLESPALLAFLPRLCRELLGEPLRMDSVPTRWCGDADSLRYVLDHFDDVVIKSTFPSSRLEPIFPAELSESKRSELIERIRSRPRDFVAQDRLEISTTPVLEGTRIVHRKMVMRSYLAASPGKDFAFMPGGLTRVSASSNTMVVSMQRGGGSKDTWVLADSEVDQFSLLAAVGSRVIPTRSGGDLPSRAADNLFWLGRYAERAEGLTRLLRGIVIRLTERSGLSDSSELPCLLKSLTLQTGFAISKWDDSEDPFAPIIPHVYSLKEPNSLASVVRSVKLVSSVVRDLISLDMWRVVNALSSLPGERTTEDLPRIAVPLECPTPDEESGPTPADVLDLLNKTVMSLAAFGGLASESMTRGEGWRFLDMGRKIERSLHIIGLLRATLTTSTDHEGPILDAVLEVLDSGMTYRRRYLNNLSAEAVLDLIVKDESNPRSLSAQLVALVEDIEYLPPTAGPKPSPKHMLGRTALDLIRSSDPEQLAETVEKIRPKLHTMLAHVGEILPVLSDAITQQYLSHLQFSRHLAMPDWIRPHDALPHNGSADRGRGTP